MKKTNAIILLLYLCLISINAKENTLIVAADPWPPFIDPESPDGGLCIEIIRESFKTQGYTILFKEVPWARAISGVKLGKYDILPDVWYSKDRSEYLYFSKPFIENKLKFIKLKTSNFEYTDIESLNGKTVGTIRDFSYDQVFMDSDIVTKEPTASLKQNILRLIYNRIDLVLEDELVAITVIKKDFPEFINKIEFCKQPLSIKNLYIASGYKNPRHKEIIDTFNKGFDEIISNGSYKNIMERYLLHINNNSEAPFNLVPSN